MSQPTPRIASLISSGTEILFALGLGENVVAVGHECDYPPHAATKPRVTRSNIDSSSSSGEIDTQVKQLSSVGASLYEFDRDALRRFQPDFIVTQAQCDVCAVRYEDVVAFVNSEPALAQTRVVALNPQSLGDVFKDILRVGEELNVTERAASCVAVLRGRVEAVRLATSQIPVEERPRVACIEWIEPLMLAANWTPELIEIAGGRSPLTQVGAHSTYASWSKVAAFDPEVIVVAPCGFDLERTIAESAKIRNWPGFTTTTAARTGRVYAVDGNAYLNRSGPRLVDSVEILAQLFHSQVFLPDQKIRPRTSSWYVVLEK